MSERLHKQWYTHSMEYDTAKKRKQAIDMGNNVDESQGKYGE